MFDQAALDELNAQLRTMRDRLPDGPWMEEPDRIEFKYRDMDCLMQRSLWGFTWCGYVGLPKSHPLYGKHYEEVAVTVHGGLTYGEICRGPICHKTQDSDDLYWLGFDTAHGFDALPVYYLTQFNMPDTQYRDVEYVIGQTKKLADQLIEMSKQ